MKSNISTSNLEFPLLNSGFEVAISGENNIPMLFKTTSINILPEMIEKSD